MTTTTEQLKEAWREVYGEDWQPPKVHVLCTLLWFDGEGERIVTDIGTRPDDPRQHAALYRKAAQIMSEYAEVVEKASMESDLSA